MRLMIVEDEIPILNGLIQIIREADTPFDDILGARDGIEAIDMMKNFLPELMITDISMPEMSGLELIEYVQELGFCSRFIILSGFGEFEYARQAIDLQVISYLVKPLDKHELIRLLNKSASEIVNEQLQESHREAIRLRELLLYNVPIEPELYNLNGFQITFSDDYYAGVMLLRQPAEEKSKAVNELIDNIIVKHLRNISDINAMLIPIEESLTAVLLSSKHIVHASRIEGLCQILHDESQIQDIKIEIGFSIRKGGLSQIHRIFQEAVRALLYCQFYENDTHFIQYQSIQKLNKNRDFSTFFNQLLSLLDSKEWTEIQSFIASIWDHDSTYTQLDALEMYYQLLAYLSTYLLNNNFDASDVLNEIYDGIQWGDLSDVKNIHKKMENRIYQTFKLTRFNQDEQCSRIVKGTIEYLHDNYINDISLEMVAEHVGCHPNYVSFLFHKEVGKNFLYYLNEYRVKKAKEYLVNQVDLTVSQISTAVGFENTRHFFKVFKKFSGITPGQYRNSYVDKS